MVTDMNKNKIKTGFSLVEILVSMAIMSFFFLASSKIMTYKNPKDLIRNPHGFFECYYEGGQKMAHIVKNGADSEPEKVQRCDFEAPTGVHFVNISVYEAPTDYVDGHYVGGFYFSSQEPLVDRKITCNDPMDILQNFGSSLGDYELTQENKEEAQQTAKRDVEEFYAYLEASHPQSYVYRQFEPLNEGEEFHHIPGGNVLFIAW